MQLFQTRRNENCSDPIEDYGHLLSISSARKGEYATASIYCIDIQKFYYDIRIVHNVIYTTYIHIYINDEKSANFRII